MPLRRPPAAHRRSTARAVAAGVVALTALGACGGGGDDGAVSEDSVPAATPVPTVGGVGQLPDPVDPARAPIMVRPPVNSDGTTAELIGEQVDGNHVLLIGDSILSSTSSRYGGHMCNALVPLGWRTQVEAEASRFIDFGNRVLDRVLPDNVTPENDVNAAVVFLGSNYGGDPVRYEDELREILDRLAPRPTLLFTVTEYRPDYAEVNEVVRRLGEEYDHVTIVDWEAVSQTPGVLSGDRLHPSDEGRRVLAELVAATLGPVALGEGDCLASQFRDDSSVRGDRDVVLGRPRSGSSGGTSGSSGGSSGSSGSGGVTTTLPPTTAPPVTDPPTTPPPTQPPVITEPPPASVPPPGDGGGTGDLGGGADPEPGAGA